jgi:hypothetical protein
MNGNWELATVIDFVVAGLLRLRHRVSEDGPEEPLDTFQARAALYVDQGLGFAECYARAVAHDLAQDAAAGAVIPHWKWATSDDAKRCCKCRGPILEPTLEDAEERCEKCGEDVLKTPPVQRAERRSEQPAG